MIKSAEAVPRKCGFWKRNRGLLYVLPWLIGFVIFKGYPFISSMYYSMLDYNLFKEGERFVGNVSICVFDSTIEIDIFVVHCVYS